jgi:hypothetical protein
MILPKEKLSYTKRIDGRHLIFINTTLDNVQRYQGSNADKCTKWLISENEKNHPCNIGGKKIQGIDAQKIT